MKEISLKTKDNIKIAVNYHNNGHESVVIVAPGWCMTKDSNVFKEISKDFSTEFDVLSMDFRGHGKSGGFFTFTSKEHLDLDAVVKYAQSENYKNIYLAGFSLGAAVALIYASQNDNINKVIAVSAPCDFDKIENHMWKKEAWEETFKKFELMRFLSIRMSIIISQKIKPIDIIEKVKCPTLFMAGEKDPTVYPWHTKALYDKAVCPKEYKLYENGFHAEDLFLYFKDDFSTLTHNFLKN